jgi:hypothetical protein
MLSSCPTDVLDDYAKQLKARAAYLATEEQREYKVRSQDFVPASKPHQPI